MELIISKQVRGNLCRRTSRLIQALELQSWPFTKYKKINGFYHIHAKIGVSAALH
jgi:hypothetical protein